MHAGGFSFDVLVRLTAHNNAGIERQLRSRTKPLFALDRLAWVRREARSEGVHCLPGPAPIERAVMRIFTAPRARLVRLYQRWRRSRAARVGRRPAQRSHDRSLTPSADLAGLAHGLLCHNGSGAPEPRGPVRSRSVRQEGLSLDGTRPPVAALRPPRHTHPQVQGAAVLDGHLGGGLRLHGARPCPFLSAISPPPPSRSSMLQVRQPASRTAARMPSRFPDQELGRRLPFRPANSGRFATVDRPMTLHPWGTPRR